MADNLEELINIAKKLYKENQRLERERNLFMRTADRLDDEITVLRAMSMSNV